MKSFQLKRLNLKQNSNFILRGHSNLSQTLIATTLIRTAIAALESKALSRAPVKPTVNQPAPSYKQGYFELAGQLLARTAFASVVVLTPVAQAHARRKEPVKKHKPRIVSVVFDAKPAAPPPVAPIQELIAPQSVKKQTPTDAKIVRTLRPVDRYADDSAEAEVDADINEPAAAGSIDRDEDDGFEAAPKVLTIEFPKIKRHVRAEAAISEADQTPDTQVVQYPTAQSPEVSKSQQDMETDINLTEEYY